VPNYLSIRNRVISFFSRKRPGKALGRHGSRVAPDEHEHRGDGLVARGFGGDRRRAGFRGRRDSGRFCGGAEEGRMVSEGHDTVTVYEYLGREVAAPDSTRTWRVANTLYDLRTSTPASTF